MRLGEREGLVRWIGMLHLWFALVFLAVVQGTFAGGGWIGCAEEGEAASQGLEVGGWDPAL